MKVKHCYIVACIIMPVILISVVCGSLIVPKIIFKQKWASSVQKLYEHLQVEPYDTLEIIGVSVDQINANQKKENRLKVTGQFTSMFFTTNADQTISESLSLKQSVESFFLKYPDLFPNMLIEVKIEHKNDSGPYHIRIANHNEQTNFVSANRNQLGYGAFYCTYGDASDFEADFSFEQLDICDLSGTEDSTFERMFFVDSGGESQLYIFGLMSDLHYLKITTNEKIEEKALQDLMQARPNCTIIINGRTVQQGE